MKLHLPISLFRALLIVTMATAATTWGAVTVLSEDTDIKNQSSALMTEDSESMGYTSADSNVRKDLTISGATVQLFTLGQDKSLSFDGLDVFRLCDNKAVTGEGALIRGNKNGNGTISIRDNNSVILDNNDTVATGSNMYGGVIRSYLVDVLIDNNSTVSICDNNFTTQASRNSNTYGGAVYVTGDCTFSMSNNGSIDISDNSLTSKETACGGAIDIGQISSTTNVLEWKGNGDITLSDNIAEGKQARGGALHAKSRGEISGTAGTISFSSNTATSAASTAFGGAISLEGNGYLTFQNNNIVEFAYNRSEGKAYTYTDPAAGGGALHGINGTGFVFTNNAEVNFIGNIASNPSGKAIGGAIYATAAGSTVLISGNDSVTFSGNGVEVAGSQYAYGGAIFSKGGVSLRDNISVVFEKNYEKAGDSFRLRSIYAKDFSSNATVNMELSAADGGSITFKDCITVSGDLTLNAKYEDKAQTGAIIFTGATTESDLNDIIAAYTPEGETARTANGEEIAVSRTSEVSGTITLNAGKLSVQEGAMLKAGVLDVKAGSTLAVEGIAAEEVTNTTIASLTTGSLTMDAKALFELNFSSEYLKNTTGGEFKMYVADITDESENETPLTLTSEQLSVGSILWDATDLKWTMEGSKAYISGSLAKNESVVVDGQPEISEDITDVDGDTMVDLTIKGDTTLSGNNSHTGGTTIANDADVTLGSNAALGNGNVSIGENVTASITTADNVVATLPTTIENNGTLTLGGKFDASDLDAPADDAEGDTYVCIRGEEGNNGFFRDGDSVINVVENGDSATLKIENGTTITYGEDTLHLATSGKAGKLTFDTYHIVDTDHVGIMSEIQKMSDGETDTIDMRGGSLLVDEDAADVQASAGTIITDGDVKLGGELSGQTTVIVDNGTAELSGANSYNGLTIIEGSESTLVVMESTALGKSTVYLQEHGTLDLNSQAVSNDIYVEGCTICDAANYIGNITVSGDLELVDNTDDHIAGANKVTFVKQGNIKSSNATLVVNSVEMATDATGEINSDLTTNEGGTIILNNGSQLKVNGALTLGKGTTFVLNGEGWAKDSELGYGDPTVDSITTGSATLANGRGTYAIAEDGTIYLTAVFDNSIAEAFSVSNWGIATASRTFVNAVRGQRTNTGCIANGRGTAWAAVLGGTSDIGNGDIDLKGAAVGADMKVGEKSSLGVAVGYIDGDARIPGLSKAEQEGTYVALYGEHGLKKLSPTSCLSLDWVAAYGQTETEWESADWAQQSLQLNTRLNWNKKLTDRLCMSVFGGLEYFTSESDRVENVKTGSIQNLRGEIGVGARYVAWGTPGTAASYDEKGALVTASRPGCEKLVLHGEIRYMNDLVRSNPVIEQDGLRGDGENPGRQGMGIEAGATYRIGERWSASANYSFNAMEDSREHRVNVGASYTF